VSIPCGQEIRSNSSVNKNGIRRNEGDPLEPLHIHVRRGEATAKFWMFPRISLAESYGMTAAELRELMRVADKNREPIERYGNEHLSIRASRQESDV